MSRPERTARRAGSPWMLVLALFCAAAGCAATSHELEETSSTEQREAPEWAITGSPPDLEEWPLCAVGVAGPTYFRADGVEGAVEKARSELARALQVRIETSTLDIQTERGGRHRSQTVMQVSSYVNEIVLHGSTIVDVWYDASGQGFAREPRCTYALVCVDEGAYPTNP